MSADNGPKKPPEKRRKRPREERAKHLERFQFAEGNNGNIDKGGGRPKGSIDIWARIRRELKAKVEQGQFAGEEYATMVAKAFVKELLKGKWPQMQELIHREEGKIADRLAGADGEPLTVEVLYRKGKNADDPD